MVAATTAAGLATLGWGARRLLVHQAGIAREVIGKPLGEQAPYADRIWKKRYGDPVDLLLLGDSIAAGLGAERRKDTLGGRVSKALARELHRSVRLTTGAVVGAETPMLPGQLAALPSGYRADVAVVVVGGNDVIHRIPLATSQRHLAEVVGALREQGTGVVVGTCPDLGALRAVPQPLRALGSRASRQLAAAQAEAAERAGAQVVPLARAVGPFFVTDPDEMFSVDRFHPSALGYRRTAAALMPAVIAALEESTGRAVAALAGEGAGGAPSVG